MTQNNISNSCFSSKSSLEPKIYVACLASYNSGIFHGEWIDATQGQDVIQDEINAILKRSSISGAEEWAIHDFEDFGRNTLSEYESISVVSEMAEFIESHGELGIKLMEHFYSIECAEDAIENYYYGEHESELDFASDLFDDCYGCDIPDNVKYYIDYDAFCRDIFMSDYFSIELHGRTHVFSNQ